MVKNFKPANVPFSFHKLVSSSNKAKSIEKLVEHVRSSILNARSGLSKLLAYPEVLELDGMSDDSVRHFLNNINSATGTRYIEVGSWRGSTFASDTKALCSLTMLCSF